MDGLWVSRPEGATRENVEPLLLEIQDRTGLPIALDGIYRWVVFVGSRQNKDRPVANRYFGVFQDGSIKVRGIDARRRDSAPFVSAAQMHLLELLAAKPMPEEALPETFDYLADRLRDLREGRVPLPDLIVRLQLSRKLEAYRTASPAARAALQLKMVGKEVRPGQRVALIYTRDEARVFAWDLPQKLNPRTVDVDRYQKLLLRAAGLVLESWGWDDERLKRKMATDLGQMRLPMPLRKHPARSPAVPAWERHAFAKPAADKLNVNLKFMQVTCRAAHATNHEGCISKLFLLHHRRQERDSADCFFGLAASSQ